MLDMSSEAQMSGEAEMLRYRILLMADETGRLPADCDDLAARTFPGRRSTASLIGSWLEELEELGCIERQEIEGERYWQVVEWQYWQRLFHARPRARTPAWVPSS